MHAYIHVHVYLTKAYLTKNNCSFFLQNCPWFQDTKLRIILSRHSLIIQQQAFRDLETQPVYIIIYADFCIHNNKNLFTTLVNGCGYHKSACAQHKSACAQHKSACAQHKKVFVTPTTKPLYCTLVTSVVASTRELVTSTRDC